MLPYWTIARVTAVGRLALALSLVFLSVTEAGERGVFEHEPDDLVAAAYTLFALFMVVIAWRSWWFDFKLQALALGADVLTFFVQPSLFHPEHEGYRLAALTLATFVLLCVALRWNWRMAAWVAAGLNGINFLILFFDPLAYLPQYHSDNDHLRSAFYLIIISVLIVWVGSRLSAPRSSPCPSSEHLAQLAA